MEARERWMAGREIKKTAGQAIRPRGKTQKAAGTQKRRRDHENGGREEKKASQHQGEVWGSETSPRHQRWKDMTGLRTDAASALRRRQGERNLRYRHHVGARETDSFPRETDSVPRLGIEGFFGILELLGLMTEGFFGILKLLAHFLP